MSLTNSTKDEYSTWFKETLKESKTIIEEANPDVSFDVDGIIAVLDKKETALKEQIGKVAALDQAKIAQVKLVNVKRTDRYKTSSSYTDSVSGHIGKEHPLSIILHQKRDGLSNPANRGPHTPPATDTPAE